MNEIGLFGSEVRRYLQCTLCSRNRIRETAGFGIRHREDVESLHAGCLAETDRLFGKSYGVGAVADRWVRAYCQDEGDAEQRRNGVGLQTQRFVPHRPGGGNLSKSGKNESEVQTRVDVLGLFRQIPVADRRGFSQFVVIKQHGNEVVACLGILRILLQRLLIIIDGFVDLAAGHGQHAQVAIGVGRLPVSGFLIIGLCLVIVLAGQGNMAAVQQGIGGNLVLLQ